MDFLLINKNNLKVTVSGFELSQKGLSGDGLKWNDEKTKSFVKEMLSSANKKLGFEYEKAKITVCVFPSVDGGAELFFTTKRPQSRYYVCLPDTTEELFLVCEALKEHNFDGTSSLYCSHDDRLVLTLCKRKLPSYIKSSPFDFSFLSAYTKGFFATEENIAFVSEHMKLLCENRTVENLV